MSNSIHFNHSSTYFPPWEAFFSGQSENNDLWWKWVHTSGQYIMTSHHSSATREDPRMSHVTPRRGWQRSSQKLISWWPSVSVLRRKRAFIEGAVLRSLMLRGGRLVSTGNFRFYGIGAWRLQCLEGDVKKVKGTIAKATRLFLDIHRQSPKALCSHHFNGEVGRCLCQRGWSRNYAPVTSNIVSLPTSCVCLPAERSTCCAPFAYLSGSNENFMVFRFVSSYFMCLDSRIGLSIDWMEATWRGEVGGASKHVKLINEKRSRQPSFAYSRMIWH